MGKYFSLCALVICSIFVFGCASNQSNRSSGGSKAERPANQYSVNFEDKAAHDPVTGNKIVRTAHKAIGTPYVLGGSNPGGFDCSGLVSWTYKSVGVKLPRTAREQSVVGKKINKIEDMRAGDIVAFRHPKRGYHTGIYVGDGKFIHSPRKRSHVRINSLSDPYFSKTLLGARRININNSENLVAQAERILGSDTMPTPSSIKRKAKASEKISASKKKSAAKTVAAKKMTNNKKFKSVTNNKKSGKSTAKNAKAAKNNTKKAKTATVAKNNAKQAKTAAVAKNNAKTTKLAASASRHHTPAAKIVANKTAQKKNSHKSVSMLQHKNAKHAAKPRNRS